MEQKQEDIKRLIDHVEKVMGKSMQAPRDFMMLYEQLKDFTGDSISISTLKRIWGYTHTDTSFSLHSLDLLSRMVGYNNWDSFLKDESDIPTSQVFVNKKLKSFSLEPGEKMKLTWQPNRVVLVEYQGCNKFKVLESQNSKLQTGDVFHCEQFMESEPLIMTHLIRKNMDPCDYICGKQSGVRWSFLQQCMRQTKSLQMLVTHKGAFCDFRHLISFLIIRNRGFYIEISTRT